MEKQFSIDAGVRQIETHAKLGQIRTKDRTAQALRTVAASGWSRVGVFAAACGGGGAATGREACTAAGGTAACSECRRASSPSDLEVGGELAGLPRGSTRYVALDALLALPQTTYTVNDDPDLAAGATKISGVPLEELARVAGRGARSGHGGGHLR